MSEEIPAAVVGDALRLQGFDIEPGLSKFPSGRYRWLHCTLSKQGEP